MSPPQPNILVYDSSVLIRRMIKEALQSSHLEGEVLIIQTAATAVSKLSHHKIDILILQMDDEEEAKELLEAGVAAGVSHAVGLSGNSKKMAHLVGRFSPQGLGKVLHRFQEPPESENMVKELVAWVTGLLKSPLPPSVSLPAPRRDILKPLGSSQLILIGTSTGGTKALEEILPQIPPQSPPLLAVVHMPKEFTPSFAKRLDLRSSITVKEAKEGERIQPHTMYIAPGGYHLRLSKDFQTLTLGSDKKVHNCRPSVDVLFQSVKGFPGRQVCGILLTGMGKDGAAGMKIIHDMGGYTIAQDEDSSVVYGMPQAAVALGAVRHILPLSQIIPQVYAEFVGLGTPP